MISTMGAPTTATMLLSASPESRQPSSPGASHRSRTLTLFAAPASPPMRCAKRTSTIEDLRLCRGSSFYQISSTKSGTPASQAPQEFQNIYPIPTTTVFIPSTAKSGGLHIVRPPVSAKIQLRKKSLLSSQNALYPGTPARSAGGSPFFRFGENIPTHTTASRRKRNENRDTYNYYS